MNETNVDLLSLHARTVLGGYRSKPSYFMWKKQLKLSIVQLCLMAMFPQQVAHYS